MSYKHCDTHDEDATNGCESCYRENVEEQRLVIIDFLRRGRNLFSPEELFDKLDTKFGALATTRRLFTGNEYPDKKREGRS